MVKSSFDKSQEAKYEGIFPLKHFIVGKEINFDLTKETPWVEKSLKMLLANLDNDDRAKAYEESKLNLNFTITKKYKHEYGDTLLLNGHLELSFSTYCVKTLQLMNEQISLDIKCCFIHRSFQEKEEFADAIELFVDGQIYELFFYDDLAIDVKGCIDEIIEVHKNPYPTKVSDNSHEIHNEPPSDTKH